MPIYEYQCRKCGRVFELMRRIAEMDAPAKCAHCASRATNRKLSRFAVVRGVEAPGVPEDESWYGDEGRYEDDHGDHDHGHPHNHGHSHDDDHHDDGGGDAHDDGDHDYSWVKDFQ